MTVSLFIIGAAIGWPLGYFVVGPLLYRLFGGGAR